MRPRIYCNLILQATLCRRHQLLPPRQDDKGQSDILDALCTLHAAGLQLLPRILLRLNGCYSFSVEPRKHTPELESCQLAVVAGPPP